MVELGAKLQAEKLGTAAVNVWTRYGFLPSSIKTKKSKYPEQFKGANPKIKLGILKRKLETEKLGLKPDGLRNLEDTWGSDIVNAANVYASKLVQDRINAGERFEDSSGAEMGKTEQNYTYEDQEISALANVPLKRRSGSLPGPRPKKLKDPRKPESDVVIRKGVGRVRSSLDIDEPDGPSGPEGASAKEEKTLVSTPAEISKEFQEFDAKRDPRARPDIEKLQTAEQEKKAALYAKLEIQRAEMKRQFDLRSQLIQAQIEEEEKKDPRASAKEEQIKRLERLERRGLGLNEAIAREQAEQFD